MATGRPGSPISSTGKTVRAILAELPLFAELAATQLDTISEACHLRQVERGEILFCRGDAPRGFFCVVSGQIQLAVSAPDGSVKVIEIISARESFGEAVMFAGKPYPVTATALLDTQLVAIPRQVVFDLLDSDSSFARRMLASMATRLHSLVADVEAYSLQSARQRVVGFLIGETHPGDEPGAQLLRLSTSKRVLASRLNLTPETMSRVLRDLVGDGFISVDGRRIVIHDRSALDRLLAWD